LEILIEILGWTGSVLVIAAYGLNSYQKIKSDSIFFQLMNLSGGAFLIIYTLYKGAFASTVINVVWVVIALSAIVALLIKKKTPS
jgi:hypothetical protein